MNLSGEPPIGLLVAITRRRIWQVVTAELAPYGTTAQQLWTMILLVQGEADSVLEIARRIGIDKAAASRLVDRLKRRGWIRLVRATRDRRRLKLDLTAEGRRQAEQFERLSERLVREMERGVTAHERRSIQTGLSRVLANLEALEARHARA